MLENIKVTSNKWDDNFTSYEITATYNKNDIDVVASKFRQENKILTISVNGYIYDNNNIKKRGRGKMPEYVWTIIKDVEPMIYKLF